MNKDQKKIVNIFDSKVPLQKPQNQEKQERISQLIIKKTLKEGITKDGVSR